MKLKNWSICVLLLSLIACKREDTAPLISQVPRVKSVDVTTSNNNELSPRVDTYDFVYDEQGRVRSINDKVFYYDSRGKVSYSRIHQLDSTETHLREYIERLRYVWDGQGRISRIVADSVYTHMRITRDNVVVSTFREMAGGFDVAEYHYVGNSHLPTSIVYRPDIKGVKLSETVQFTYEGNNVRSSKQKVYSNLLPPEAAPGDPPQIFYFLSHFRYNDKPHFLHAIFKQLGFHPYLFGSVISANAIDAAYQAVLQDESSQVTPDWAKATTYRTAFGPDGYATEIVLQGMHGSVTRIAYY